RLPAATGLSRLEAAPTESGGPSKMFSGRLLGLASASLSDSSPFTQKIEEVKFVLCQGNSTFGRTLLANAFQEPFSQNF
ncbi:MAG: hypothetical protein M0Z81_04890, partial [Deltaproteobacteria bacterium]|nr:hypothetical protein [Deltaproteobacteria bacterium]